MASREVAVKRYVVRLGAEERERLEGLRRKGEIPARRLTKVQILLNELDPIRGTTGRWI